MDNEPNRIAKDGQDTRKEVIVQVEPACAEWSVAPVTVTMRVYYSMYHAWSSRHFAAMAGRIEDAHESGSTFDIRHRYFVTGAIFAAVSFLESAVNELFKDAFDCTSGKIQYTDYVNSLDPVIVRRLADIWKFTEANNKSRFSSLQKYEIALDIASQALFDKGEQPYQDASLLIKLRNELIHFKPETLGTHQLDDRLRGKFPLNRLMNGSGNPFFPDHCLGHGCCEWAVSSSEAFADAFFARLGLTPKYRVAASPDPTAT